MGQGDGAIREPAERVSSSHGEADRQQFLDGLARRYSRALNRFFERRAPALGSEREDMAQEVFERLAQRGPGEAIAHAEAYLFQTAANVLTDRIRRRSVRRSNDHVQYDENAHAIEDFSAERVLAAREQVEMVVAALEDLPERTRFAFVLHRFEGMKQAEIARRLGISVSAVEKHIVRALTHVRARTGEGAQ
jgi:RNA polymerase sigma-70 factor (ECF subfamily)